MKLKDKAGWETCVANNTDGYESAVIRYVEAWANLMEERNAAGETVEQCAKDASHKADTEGISGFMYGCAVSILAGCWEHGEALRRWHNLETQVGVEGIIANENGKTLNPALLVVSAPEAPE